jgi:hypothetical protein
MSLEERDTFHLALKVLVGEVRYSEVMHGGELFAFPSSQEQQDKLLNLSEVAGRIISCSLPVTANPSFKGVILGVPIPDKEEEFLAALADQNVIHVKRLPIKRHPEIFCENVILTFSAPLPVRVKITAMSHRVKNNSQAPSGAKTAGNLATPPPDALEYPLLKKMREIPPYRPGLQHLLCKLSQPISQVR